jgi:hypothetical protein
MQVRLWPAWFDRQDAEPRWAWRLIGLSVGLFVATAAVTVLGGLAILILLAFR